MSDTAARQLDEEPAIFRRPLTDVGNAELFVDQNMGEILRNHTRGVWMIWNGTRWVEDFSRNVQYRVRQTHRSRYREAADITDVNVRKKTADFALKCEAAGRQRSTIDLAQDDPRVAVVETDFDPDVDSINTESGIVNLRTGQLSPHDSAAMHSKIAPVSYDPDDLESLDGIPLYIQESPLFTKFLNEVTCGRPDMIEYLQVHAGYCLTGRISEQTASIHSGGGSNGKGVFTGAQIHIMGYYALSPSPELMIDAKGGGATPEVAALRGVRLASIQETDDGGVLSESKFKRLTGGDRISARYLFSNPFEFDPTHKIILSTNHRPRIRTGGHSIWRRVRLIPWDYTVPDDQIDRDLSEKLVAEYPAIFAWMVDGARKWYRSGMPDSMTVADATGLYRDSEDRLKPFLDDACIESTYETANRADLYKTYCHWAEVEGERPMGNKSFFAALRERGYEEKTYRTFHGLGLRR